MIVTIVGKYKIMDSYLCIAQFTIFWRKRLEENTRLGVDYFMSKQLYCDASQQILHN